jgi:hypothetical protein
MYLPVCLAGISAFSGKTLDSFLILSSCPLLLWNRHCSPWVDSMLEPNQDKTLLSKTTFVASVLSQWCKHLVWLGCCFVSVLLIAIQSNWGVQAVWADNTPANSPPSDIQPLLPSRSGLDASAISTEKISQFVQVYLKVVNLIEQRESDLQSAETEAESIQLQQTIRAEAVDLIKAEGLTLQEYLQILGLANVDAEFGERVAAQLQEAES